MIRKIKKITRFNGRDTIAALFKNRTKEVRQGIKSIAAGTIKPRLSGGMELIPFRFS